MPLHLDGVLTLAISPGLVILLNLLYVFDLYCGPLILLFTLGDGLNAYGVNKVQSTLVEYGGEVN